jgi:hypothetical protein
MKVLWPSYRWFAAMGSAAHCSVVVEESLVETDCVQGCENLEVVGAAMNYCLEVVGAAMNYCLEVAERSEGLRNSLLVVMVVVVAAVPLEALLTMLPKQEQRTVERAVG